MQKPNLDRMWEMWIRIGVPQGTYQSWIGNITAIIKSQINDLFTLLEREKLVDWYHFLIHSKEGDPSVFYFHIRISLRNGVKSGDLLNILPDYCLDPKPIERKSVESISGIAQQLLRNKQIEEVWQIIGKQSKWIIDMLNLYKDENIPVGQFVQFMHFYMNMLGLGRMSKLTLPPMVYSF